MQSPLWPWFWWTDWLLANLQAFCSSVARLISVEGWAWHQTWEAASQDALQSTLNILSVSFRGMSSKSVITRWQRFIFKCIKTANLQIYVKINIVIKTQRMNIHSRQTCFTLHLCIATVTCSILSVTPKIIFTLLFFSSSNTGLIDRGEGGGIKAASRGISGSASTTPNIKTTTKKRKYWWFTASKESIVHHVIFRRHCHLFLCRVVIFVSILTSFVVKGRLSHPAFSTCDMPHWFLLPLVETLSSCTA